MYKVFIQWHENTGNYRRFDGGLEAVGKRIKTVKAANIESAEYLFVGDNNYFYYPFNETEQEKYKGLQLGIDDTTVVIDFNSAEPANVDFGDGTIYVAEVVE